jgi:hypothetical protein
MPIILTDLARSIGVALGRISRQLTYVEKASQRPPAARPAGLGATEDQVNMAATVPERINRIGTKVEDLAGTGVHDAPGG